MIDISELDIKLYQTQRYWDFGNKILYDLCRDNFKHDQDDIILAKVLFIGRTYSAAIERRKNKNKLGVNNDNFYINHVVPTFRNSNLDKHLTELKNLKLDTTSLLQVLEVHYDLMKTLSKITDSNKRSFCSKYLHFHLPELFFIYDSRAVIALRDFTRKVPKELLNVTRRKNVDTQYAECFCKCFDLKNKIEAKHKVVLTPRQIDNILIETANSRK